MDIPDEASDHQFSKWGFMVQVKVLIGGSDSCSQNATAYEMSYLSLGTVSLIIAGVLCRRKRRNVETAENDSSETHFVEFKDMSETIV